MKYYCNQYKIYFKNFQFVWKKDSKVGWNQLIVCSHYTTWKSQAIYYHFCNIHLQSHWMGVTHEIPIFLLTSFYRGCFSYLESLQKPPWAGITGCHLQPVCFAYPPMSKTDLPSSAPHLFHHFLQANHPG